MELLPCRVLERRSLADTHGFFPELRVHLPLNEIEFGFPLQLQDPADDGQCHFCVTSIGAPVQYQLDVTLLQGPSPVELLQDQCQSMENALHITRILQVEDEFQILYVRKRDTGVDSSISSHGWERRLLLAEDRDFEFGSRVQNWRRFEVDLLAGFEYVCSAFAAERWDAEDVDVLVVAHDQLAGVSGRGGVGEIADSQAQFGR